MKEKITLKKEIVMLSNIAIRIIILIALSHFLEFERWFNVLAISVTVLPILYLHLQYSYSDRNKALVLDNHSVRLQINDKEFDLSTSNKIIINGHVALTRNVIPIFLSPNYYNVRFISEKFGEVSVSSLVYKDLKKLIVEHFNEDIVSYEYFWFY